MKRALNGVSKQKVPAASKDYASYENYVAVCEFFKTPPSDSLYAEGLMEMLFENVCFSSCPLVERLQLMDKRLRRFRVYDPKALAALYDDFIHGSILKGDR